VGETFALGPTRLRVVTATPEATVLDGELDPGGGSGWHMHTLEDETLIVTSGTLVVDDGARRELAAGDAHVLPRGRRHAFANESGEIVRLYFVCTPGGLERFFRALAAGEPAEAAAARAGLIFD
jgi:quercetin dioxygenase-like cupin family protein